MSFSQQGFLEISKKHSIVKEGFLRGMRYGGRGRGTKWRLKRSLFVTKCPLLLRRCIQAEKTIIVRLYVV